MRTLTAAAAMFLLAACGADADGSAADDTPEPAAACTIEQTLTPLPLELAETSGAVAGPGDAGWVWTHTDSGGDAALFAVATDGRLLATVPITDARNTDWEDIAAAPCAGGRCLWLADVGDNEAKRDDVDLYRVPEPDPARPAPVAAERFRIRYPDGPRDAESVFVTPDGAIYLLTKGRTSPLELYRYPGTPDAGRTAVMERVASFSADRLPLPAQVTGADVSPDGRRIAVRSYRALTIHPLDRFLRGDLAAGRTVDLDDLDEPQGEGVAWLDDERIVLTSEGVGKEEPGLIAVVNCGDR